MSKKGSSFLTTFGLISRVRIGYAGPPRFGGTLVYMPVIGILAGLISFGVFTGLVRVLPDPFIVILIVVCLQYLLFNLFHFDGFLDTADALFCFAGKEKRHDILKDSRAGTFAVFFGALYVGVKLYLLTKSAVYFYILDTDPLSRTALIFLFFTYPVSGRSAAALLPLITKPAKSEGLGAALKDAKPWTAFIGLFLSHIPVLGLFLTAMILNASVSPLFLLVCGGAFAAFLLTGLFYRRKVGGYTGDAFGFAVEIGELVHILTFYLLLTFGLG